MHNIPSLSTTLPTLALLVGMGWMAQDSPTYDDTPFLPGSEFRVHGARPWPAIVHPGNESQAPSDAVVLFDGHGLEAWQSGGQTARWKLAEDYVEVNGTGSMATKAEFGDMQLHLEFQTPAQVQGSSQGRGNSGVFLMGRYELQILDSYENPSYPDGQCSALYGQCPPRVNASRKPGSWQSYDVLFRAPVFDGEKLVEPARVSVLHNGVLTHWDQPFIGATTHRAVAKYSAHAPKGPIQLQDHGNPTRFRNIWVREL